MKIFKTQLHSTVLAARLNGFTLVYIDKTEPLSTTDVVSVFAQKKIEKLNLLTKYLV